MVLFETPNAKPTPFEQTLAAQGDMLAELNVLMARFQGSTKSEYHDFVAEIEAELAAAEAERLETASATPA
jgi:beta-lactamase superfamily II metal-dependent hydrolase